jgi:AcrR family transcriptional regulator
MSARVAANHREQYRQVRRQQILDAAVQVFGEKGFARAVVADIAEAAGIAKGTVYLYFPSKEEIFTAILIERSFVPHLADLMVDDQPLDITLRNIAESFYRFLDTKLPIYRIAIADSYYFPDLIRVVYSEVILIGNQALADFLVRQSEAGVIRPLANPFLTARTFMGLLSTHILSQEILGGKEITPISDEAWIEEIIQIYLEGVKPGQENSR